MEVRPARVIVGVVVALIPGLVILIALLMRPASQPTGKGCQPSILHSAALTRQNVLNRPWARAEPEAAGIAAYLPPGNEALQSQVALDLIWIVDGPERGDVVEVFGLNTTNGVDYIRQRFVRDELLPTDYEGALTLPSPGCWEFDVKSGSAAGKVTLWVPK